MSQGKGDKRRQGKNYEKNYESIFGKDKKAETSFRRYGASRDDTHSVYIVEDLEPFKSPITGEIISSRSQLRQHHREHGTTDARDYSSGYFEKKAREREAAINGRTDSDRQNRIEILRDRMN